MFQCVGITTLVRDCNVLNTAHTISERLLTGRFGKPNGNRKTTAAAVEASTSSAPVEKPAQPKVCIYLFFSEPLIEQFVYNDVKRHA